MPSSPPLAHFLVASLYVLFVSALEQIPPTQRGQISVNGRYKWPADSHATISAHGRASLMRNDQAASLIADEEIIIPAPLPLTSVRDVQAFAPDLVKLGIEIFGSAEHLENFLRQTAEPKGITWHKQHIMLKTSLGDNAFQRLSVEAETDGGYQTSRVTEADGVMVDVGGNIGVVSIDFALEHPGMQVLTLEPVPSTYFLLRLNMRLNAVQELSEEDLGKPGKSGVIALHRALTSDGRTVQMHHSLNSTLDSLIVGQDVVWQNGSPTWETDNVESVALPAFLLSHSVTQIRFLKMDCEGCEFEAVPTMRGFLDDTSKVQRFAGEIHRCKVTGAEDPASTKEFDSIFRGRGCTPQQPGSNYFADGMIVC